MYNRAALKRGETRVVFYRMPDGGEGAASMALEETGPHLAFRIRGLTHSIAELGLGRALYAVIVRPREAARG